MGHVPPPNAWPAEVVGSVGTRSLRPIRPCGHCSPKSAIAIARVATPVALLLTTICLMFVTADFIFQYSQSSATPPSSHDGQNFFRIFSGFFFAVRISTNRVFEMLRISWPSQ